MLDIVASYHCIQFQGKLINQENGKKPSFRPDFGAFGPNLVPKHFSWILPLPNVASYHCIQFQGQLIY